jgi:cell division transport system permease protein
MLKRSLIEGTKYFLRTFWISSIAITVLTLSTGLIAIAFSSRQLVNTVLRQFDKKATIQILIEDGATELDLKQTENALKALPGVATVTFTSKEQEKSRLSTTEQSTSDYTVLFEELGFNPFLNSFTVGPKSAEEYKTVVSAVQNINFSKSNKVQKVVAKQELIDSLTLWYNRINLAGWIFVVIFGLISIIVIVNILRISISYFQQEIEIQRLVGATNRYIQGPFIFQGFLFSFFASVLVLVMQGAFFWAIIPNLGRWFGISDTGAIQTELFFSLGAIIATSMIIATLAAWYSTTRYLKK